MKLFSTVLFVACAFFLYGQGSGGYSPVEIIRPNTQCFEIWGEESGTLNANQAEFSYGNGNVRAVGNSSAFLTQFNGQINKMSISAENGGTIDTDISIIIDGAEVYIGKMIGGESTFVSPNLDVFFTENQVIDFKTKIAGGASGVVVKAFICYEL